MTRPYHSVDEDRERMIAETSAFITWGLAHPGLIRWIPRRPESSGSFTWRATVVFWGPILTEAVARPLDWVRSLLKR